MRTFDKLNTRAGRLTGVALAVLAVTQHLDACAAGQADDNTTKVVVTGSIIPRISMETALPVSNITAEEIKARGNIEFKEMLLEMPESMTIGSYSGTVGTLVNLRGLGQARSLTLMNGRRFANEPLTDQYVSANVIPTIVLQRVETLRDGASSAYGSDAIGGVQNFLTFKKFTGVKLKADVMQPERKGGGNTNNFGIMAGKGDLGANGWNIYGAFEVSKRPVLFKRDRPELSGLDANGLPQTSASADLVAMGGANLTDLTASQTSPANFLTTLSKGVPSGTVYNPYANTCSPPMSVPSSTSPSNTTCAMNTRGGDTGTYGNETALYNAYVRGTVTLAGGQEVSLELNHSQNDIGAFSNVVGTTNSAYYLSLPKSSPWYPGGSGGVPAVMNGKTVVADASVATTPATLYLRWLPMDFGTPVIKDRHLNDRAVLAIEGSYADWDYRAGLNFGKASRNTMRSGVFGTAALQSGLNNGSLNPFGMQNAAGLDVLRAAKIDGQTVRYVTTRKSVLDFTASKEIFQLPGGGANLGVGGEVRRDDWSARGFEWNNYISVPGAIQTLSLTTATANLANLVPTVWMGALPNSNQPDSTMSGSAHRTIFSLFSEIDLPVTKTLTLNASARGDAYRYSFRTFKGVNPKLSARWAPNSVFMLRGSANTGFRNPALPEVHGNSEEFRGSVRFNDPLYCASGVNTSKTLPNEAVCNISVTEVTKARLGGTQLVPEKSRAYTFGFGIQPAPNMSVTVDYWNTKVTNVLGQVAVDSLVANYARYEAQFVRNPDGSINKIQNVKQNAGDMRAAGADMNLRVSQNLGNAGTFTFGWNVSYIGKFESLLNGDNVWIDALNMSEPLGITTQDGLTGNRAQISKWKYTASLGWSKGAWNATLAQRYQGKMRDRNEPARVTAPGSVGERDVAPYSQYNLTASYRGFARTKLTFGINNLTNVNPPLTNNSRYQAYLTQNADVLGRAYRFSAEYTF